MEGRLIAIVHIQYAHDRTVGAVLNRPEADRCSRTNYQDTVQRAYYSVCAIDARANVPAPRNEMLQKTASSQKRDIPQKPYRFDPTSPFYGSFLIRLIEVVKKSSVLFADSRLPFTGQVVLKYASNIPPFRAKASGCQKAGVLRNYRAG